MNCACGHSVFDHAKVYEVVAAEPWRGVGGMFFHSVAGPYFTLSGSCEAFRKGESYRDCGCRAFTSQSRVSGLSRSQSPELWKQFDRPAEKMEVM